MQHHRYKAAFKGGVYEARETIWAFRGAEIDVWRRWKAGQTLDNDG
jgi:hypothetical protein